MINWLVIGGALLTGVLGGAHCAAMCGGIATAFPGQQRGGWWAALQPNLGRIAGYTLAGAIVGGLGHALLDAFEAPLLGVALRAAVGAVLIVAALRLLDTRGRLALLARPGQQLWQWLRPLTGALLPADTLPKRLLLGLLWGWLPCGLSTTLLAAAWLQADPLQGALTMAAFGLGTLPVMLPLTWSGARIGRYLQQGGFRVAAGSMVFAAGALTLAAPLLIAHVPAVHGVLKALGCQVP